MTCENCVHSAPYPAPAGPEPEMPEAPGGLFFGSHFAWEFALYRWSSWLAKKDRFETKVECRRFPEFVQRKKVEACGEFTPDPFALD